MASVRCDGWWFCGLRSPGFCFFSKIRTKAGSGPKFWPVATFAPLLSSSSASRWAVAEDATKKINVGAAPTKGRRRWSGQGRVVRRRVRAIRRGLPSPRNRHHPQPVTPPHRRYVACCTLDRAMSELSGARAAGKGHAHLIKRAPRGGWQRALLRASITCAPMGNTSCRPTPTRARKSGGCAPRYDVISSIVAGETNASEGLHAVEAVRIFRQPSSSASRSELDPRNSDRPHTPVLKPHHVPCGRRGLRGPASSPSCRRGVAWCESY